MRYLLPLLLILIIIAGCKKKALLRTNFLELKVDGKQLFFDIKDTAVLDTVYPATYWEFTANDNRSPYSNLRWVLLSDSKWVNGVYEYAGINIAGRSIFYIYLTTYVSGPYDAYYVNKQNLNYFTIKIDQSDNGRLHGTFSGTMTNSSGVTPGLIVKVTDGEFEMPYRFH
jgi:hypothetical protein